MSDRLESCCSCGEHTGRAGKGEDSIYCGDVGPFCEDCYQELRESWQADNLLAEIERLRGELGRANKLTGESQSLCDMVITERDDYQRALEQYALHRNWSCCDLGENHAHGEQCCRDWWQGADDEDLDSGYVLAEEVLKRYAAKAAGGTNGEK